MNLHYKLCSYHKLSVPRDHKRRDRMRIAGGLSFGERRACELGPAIYQRQRRESNIFGAQLARRRHQFGAFRISGSEVLQHDQRLALARVLVQNTAGRGRVAHEKLVQGHRPKSHE